VPTTPPRLAAQPRSPGVTQGRDMIIAANAGQVSIGDVRGIERHTAHAERRRAAPSTPAASHNGRAGARNATSPTRPVSPSSTSTSRTPRKPAPPASTSIGQRGATTVPCMPVRMSPRRRGRHQHPDAHPPRRLHPHRPGQHHPGHISPSHTHHGSTSRTDVAPSTARNRATPARLVA